MPKTSTDPLTRAQREAVITPLPQQARYLIDSVGQRITAVAVGVRDTRTVRSWTAGEPMRLSHGPHRLQVLYTVVRAIDEVYPGGAVAAAFLRGMNPELDDRSVLLELADNDPAGVEADILGAVRAFLNG